MRLQKEITLLSGIKCTIQEMTGESEFFLTNEKYKAKGKGLIALMTDCILSIGDKTTITDNDIKRLLSGDRKKALIEIRQLSNDEDPVFNFKYEFASTGGIREKFEYSYQFDEKSFPGKNYAQQYKNLSEIKREIEFILPRSQQKVVWTMLDVDTESEHDCLHDMEGRSSLTMLELRNPMVFFKDKNNDGQEVERSRKVDLKKMNWKDIDSLRKNVLDTEGNVDTLLTIQHKKDKEKEVRIDLLSVPAFFFPSLGN